MESQDIRNLLKNLKRYKESKKQLQQKLEILRTQATRITASYGNKGGGSKSTDSRIESNVIKMDEIKDSIRKLDILINSAEKYLRSLKYYQRRLVEDCLVKGMTFEEVAVREDTSENNIKKIVDNAIKNLTKI